MLLKVCVLIMFVVHVMCELLESFDSLLEYDLVQERGFLSVV